MKPALPADLLSALEASQSEGGRAVLLDVETLAWRTDELASLPDEAGTESMDETALARTLRRAGR